MIGRRYLLLLLTFFLLVSGCIRKQTPGEEKASSFTWSTGSLKVVMSFAPAPENIGEFQDFNLEITTLGSEPVIEFPDFSSGGFMLTEWEIESPLSEEDEMSFRYIGRLEPLTTGVLYIPPIRILSGDEISDVLVSEGFKVEVASMLSQEEVIATTGGQFPKSSPPESEPEKGSRGLIIIFICLAIIIAVGIIIMIVYHKKRKKKVIPPTPSEAALRKTADLNPENYTEFYTQAAEIIRESGTLAGDLEKILEYYELEAYTGRLGKKTYLSRSPHEDKVRMMVLFTRMGIEGGEG